MTLQYITKDITTVERGIIAQGVNCQGVQGSGIALAIRNKWPIVYEPYRKHATGQSRSPRLLGQVVLVDVGDQPEQLMIANCFTQHMYGKDGKRYADPNAIAVSMATVIHMAETMRLPIYMPRIGSGLGGLRWADDVEPIIRTLTNGVLIDIFVCDLEVA